MARISCRFFQLVPSPTTGLISRCFFAGGYIRPSLDTLGFYKSSLAPSKMPHNKRLWRAFSLDIGDNAPSITLWYVLFFYNNRIPALVQLTVSQLLRSLDAQQHVSLVDKGLEYCPSSLMPKGTKGTYMDLHLFVALWLLLPMDVRLMQPARQVTE